MTYKELYEKGTASLVSAGVPDAPLDARLLLEFICHTNRNDLLVHGDRHLTREEEEQYLEWIGRRALRIPLQQITGEQNFMGLDFLVNEHVLIPRQDTEILVEEVLRELHDGMRILDMCTGSGCILISLLHYSNNCIGVGVDLSADALRVARENAVRLLPRYQVSCYHEVVSPGDGEDLRVHFMQADLFACGEETLQEKMLQKCSELKEVKFEFIVSNPPYIPSAACETLMPEVRDHEPRMALDGSADGLSFYRRIIEEAPEYLTCGGRLYFEIGFDQGDAVKTLMEDAGFYGVTVVKDYAGLDRVVYGIK